MLEFRDDRYEWRRLFSELLGTFMLVFVAAGGGIVNARFGGNDIPQFILVTAPGMMVLSIILFMGAVSGAHLNPGVSLAFALRGDFPWRRVPGYIIVQFVGAILATLVVVALLGKQGNAGLTLPGPGIGAGTALVWEIVLTAGLVSVILGVIVGRPGRGLGRRHRRGQLHRPGRHDRRLGERRLDEHGPLAGARHRPLALHRLVGLPDRPAGRARSSPWASPTILRGPGGDANARRAGSGSLDTP